MGIALCDNDMTGVNGRLDYPDLITDGHKLASPTVQRWCSMESSIREDGDVRIFIRLTGPPGPEGSS